MNRPQKDQGFWYKKSLGQNFIFDKNLLGAIVSDAGITAQDSVLEVGTGAATLTAAIAASAKKVVTVEVDDSLLPLIAQNLQGFSNVQTVQNDILKLSHGDIARLLDLPSDCNHGNRGESCGEDIDCTAAEGFKVVANLPYYITTPVIFHFLESRLPIKSLTVTVQKEVALRMTAKPSTPDYGALTLAIKARADAKITRHIGRNMFTPPPNVDSAVVRMDIKRSFDPHLASVIKSVFASRRKTVLNNLQQSFGLGRAQCADVLDKAGISQTARGEQLDLEEISRLASKLSESKKSGK